jgi:hypothetical protein
LRRLDQANSPGAQAELRAGFKRESERKDHEEREIQRGGNGAGGFGGCGCAGPYPGRLMGVVEPAFRRAVALRAGSALLCARPALFRSAARFAGEAARPSGTGAAVPAENAGQSGAAARLRRSAAGVSVGSQPCPWLCESANAGPGKAGLRESGGYASGNCLSGIGIPGIWVPGLTSGSLSGSISGSGARRPSWRLAEPAPQCPSAGPGADAAQRPEL